MKKIYLMPFSSKSVLLYHALLDRGIFVTGFFDNDSAIQGMLYMDCLISSPALLSEPDQNVLVILCEPRHYEANGTQLIRFGYRNINKIDEWLRYEEASHFIANINGEIFRNIVPRQANSLKLLPFRIPQFLLPEFVKHSEALVIDVLDVLVTEKCSLKCKNCANLMQYFINPQNMSLEQVYRDIDLIFSKVDWIRNFYIFGGEAFLYKQLSQVMEYTSQYKKQFGILGTFTNGTIVPPDDMLLSIKENEMLVTVSDYREYSNKINELINKFEIYQIPYQRGNVKWFDYKQLVRGENRDAEKIFSKCKANCATLRNGLLYRCPFLVNAETLRAVPYSEYNHIDISLDEINKSDIADYLAKPVNYSRTIPPGCAYCSGYNVGNMREIPVAEQAKAPLPYTKY